MPLEVRQVCTRRDRTAFLRLPWRIYASDPHWVPPLLLERREFINPAKHPFYRHGSAALFVAWQEGECVGRIMASDDPRFNEFHRSQVGCFGMFECVPDSAVAGKLLEAAAGWLRARGRRELWGPIDYSMNYACGLLVDGFDTPPRVLMNHQPPYYAQLLQDWGLVKAKDLYSWWFLMDHPVLQHWTARAQRAAERHKVTVRPFQVRNLQAEVMRCKSIYNEAWKDNWGFVPMTDLEFTFLAKNLTHWAIPELLILAEVAGETVGFSMALPDFNEATRSLNGHLFSYGLPLGWLEFRRRAKQIRTARLLTLGVLESFRRRGVAELLIQASLEYARERLGYTGAELGWTLEDNRLINRTIEAVGGSRYKTYRIFSRAI